MKTYASTSSATPAHMVTTCALAFGAGSLVRGELRSLRTFTVIPVANADVVGPQVWSPPV